MLGSELTPLEGGYSGETFLADSGDEHVVVRIYGRRSAERGPEAIDIDAAVLRLVHGLLPVPRVLELRRPARAADVPAILVTEMLPGRRLDQVLPEADAALRHRIGTELGGVLQRLGGMPFLSPGPFVDAGLRTGSWGPECADLPTFVADLRERSALRQWPAREYDALVSLAETAQDLLDPIVRTCLVHSDFNAKNILVDPETGCLTGLLDWEFARAGPPVADLGNLLRYERDPALVEGVLSVFDPPGLDGDLVQTARAADLWAVVELAARRGEHAETERAHDQLVAAARTGRLDSGASG